MFNPPATFQLSYALTFLNQTDNNVIKWHQKYKFFLLGFLKHLYGIALSRYKNIPWEVLLLSNISILKMKTKDLPWLR